jgi:ketosteroid isomerase-like protein
MRKTTIRVTLVLLVVSPLFKAHSQEATKAHKDSLRQAVDLYYAQNLKIFQKTSSKKDIDDLFQLFTDDFVYVHPKYGGEYSRQDLYSGYVNNQKRGRYDGSIVDIRISNKITGLNGLVTERSYVKKAASGEEEVDPGMTLFEFREGKISKIFEYW